VSDMFHITSFGPTCSIYLQQKHWNVKNRDGYTIHTQSDISAAPQNKPNKTFSFPSTNS
jgi:hypothetical protein